MNFGGNNSQEKSRFDCSIPKDQVGDMLADIHAAELNRSKFTDLVADIQASLDTDARVGAAMGQQRLQAERDQAHLHVRAARRAEQQEYADAEHARAVADRRATDAVTSRAAIEHLMAKSFEAMAATKEEAERTAAAHENRKIAAVVRLKKTRDLVNDRDRESLREKERRAQVIAMVEAAERDALTDQGLNADAVLLARAREAAKMAERQRVLQRTREHERAVVVKLLAEESRTRKNAKERASRSTTSGTSARCRRSSNAMSALSEPPNNADLGVDAADEAPETMQEAQHDGGDSADPGAMESRGDTTSYSDAAMEIPMEGVSDDAFGDFDGALDIDAGAFYAQPEFDGLWDDTGATTSAMPPSSLSTTTTDASTTHTTRTANDSAVVPTAAHSSSIPQARVRSVLEQQMMADVLERQRAGIVRPQVVKGKTFTGTAAVTCQALSCAQCVP